MSLLLPLNQSPRMLTIQKLVLCCLMLLPASYAFAATRPRFEIKLPTISISKDLSVFTQKARMIAATLAFVMTFATPSSFAAVGEGDLPDGAMAFSKISKFQKDWKVLAESLEKRNLAEIDEKELLSIKFFLKQLANEYYDMEVSFPNCFYVYNLISATN